LGEDAACGYGRRKDDNESSEGNDAIQYRIQLLTMRRTELIRGTGRFVIGDCRLKSPTTNQTSQMDCAFYQTPGQGLPTRNAEFAPLRGAYF
jgi:hypothetical protein